MGDKSEASVSRQTLEATYGRAVQFLRGAGTNPVIRALLEARGYSANEHSEGWRLVLAAGGHEGPAPGFMPALSSEAHDAMVKVDAWDEPTHRVLRASLARRFPEQCQFLLEGLTPASGMTAVAGVATLLDRLDALESGEGREGSRKQDQSALDLLAQRGITPAVRKEMRALVGRAQQGVEASAPDPKQAATDAAREAQHHEALVALRHWFEEWSEIARVALTRRDHLISVGLAKRKAPKAAKGGG